MTGNTFSGEKCIYCCVRPSETDDHVFAKKFFNVRQRGNLPQVPACKICNGEKAKLEQELMVVLAFGGRHADASENLAAQERRLANNLKQLRTLRKGIRYGWVREQGVWRRVLQIPVDWLKVHELFVYITKGLAWRHFDKLELDADCFVEAHSLVGSVGGNVRHLLGLNVRSRVEQNLGGGTFHYRGAQAIDNPQITVWEFTILGGLRVASNAEGPHNIGAMTGPKRARIMAEQAALLSRWHKGARLRQ